MGNWWLLPLCPPCHEIIGKDRDEISRRRWGFVMVGPFDCEKLLFIEVVERRGQPFGDEVMQAILEYRR